MPNPKAAMLVIGDEILSGRTRDSNMHHLAQELTRVGIDLVEMRIVADDRDAIIGALRALAAGHAEVFTSGGIGPTHDDITSECIARAFSTPWEPHPVAWQRMADFYAGQNPPGEFNAARQRMATMPRGCVLIENEATIAPGFSMENVHVMAGVPRIMQAMFQALAPRLQRGEAIVSATVHADGIFEGGIAEALSAVQDAHPDLDIGSYPYFRPMPVRGGVALVAKGTDAVEVAQAADAIEALLLAAGGQPVRGEPITD